ncbi:MAG: hypothetical protein R6V11_09740 [Ectothiorhodospiraceae bacterium]
MAKPAARVHLSWPGLLGPVPSDAIGLVDSDAELDRLAGLLAKGRPGRPAHEMPQGFRLSDGGTELPAGPLGLLGAGGDPGDNYWFRADPVHFVADRDRLRVVGPDALDVTVDEADALVAAFNDFYRDDGLELLAPRPDVWYLRCAEVPRLATTPLEQAREAPVDESLPQGADAPQWRARLNETQMLLHGHTVNQEREARGQPTINGIWPWGGGRLPRVTTDWDRVLGDDTLLLGLARAAGAATGDSPGDPAAVVASGEAVLVASRTIPTVRDQETFLAWQQAVTQLAAAWAQPLAAGLRSGALRELVVDAGSGGQRRVRPGSLFAFWRRPRAFAHLLATS